MVKGQGLPLQLFLDAATTIPAYADFLKKSGFDANTVESLDDFQRVPLTSKKTYLTHYQHKDLMWPADVRLR